MLIHKNKKHNFLSDIYLQVFLVILIKQFYDY